MPQKGLVGSRVVVDRLFALLPPEGVPASTLPQWELTDVRILTAPAMGAAFVQYQLDMQVRGGTSQRLAPHVEAFFFVFDGEITLTLGGQTLTLRAGGFAYLPPGSSFEVQARAVTRMLWLKKAHEPLEGKAPWVVSGEDAKVAGEAFMGMPELLLKKLLPEDPAFDMAMNIFTFQPGHGLPMTETHVMEHGLAFLQGQGLYLLGDRWLEVQAGDFIWMGPYCPQSFFATGTEPARYLYYKNVNRDVPLLP